MQAQVSNPEKGKLLFFKFAQNLIKDYLGEEWNLCTPSRLEAPTDLRWIVFGYKGQDLSFGFQEAQLDSAGIFKILKSINSSMSLKSVDFELSGLQEKHCLEFSRGGKNIYFWVASHNSVEFDPAYSHEDKRALAIRKVFVPIYVPLKAAIWANKLVLRELDIHLQVNAVKSASELHFNLLAKNREKILKMEECEMNDQVKLRTVLKMGALEMSLDDLLHLGPGSEIKFSLPEKTEVELELGGQIVGRGELVVAGEKFVVFVK